MIIFSGQLAAVSVYRPAGKPCWAVLFCLNITAKFPLTTKVLVLKKAQKDGELKIFVFLSRRFLITFVIVPFCKHLKPMLSYEH